MKLQQKPEKQLFTLIAMRKKKKRPESFNIGRYLDEKETSAMDLIQNNEEVFNKTEFIQSPMGLRSSSCSLQLGCSKVGSFNSMKKLVPNLN